MCIIAIIIVCVTDEGYNVQITKKFLLAEVLLESCV